LIIRSAKNVALAVQQECGLSILYGCPRVTLETLNWKKSEGLRLRLIFI